MKTFTDSTGRNWNIEITLGSARRVKDLIGINLLAPEQGDPPLLTKLGTDEMVLCDVLYCLVKPQADKDGVSDEQFAASLDGDAIYCATKAFYQELIDFFQKSGRSDRRKMTATQAKVIELAVQRVEQKISSFDLNKQLDQIFGESFMNLPES